MGDMFIKMPKPNVETMIKKGTYNVYLHCGTQHRSGGETNVLIYFFYFFFYPRNLDQVTLDSEIADIRQVMKKKVVELEKLEGGDGSKSRAFQLKGMTP